MAETQWYELRVSGSAGTSSAICIDVGIALTDTGRLCLISSGEAKRFDSEEEAIEFLSKTSIPGIYPFEPVLCGVTIRVEAGRAQSSVGLAT